MPVHTRASQRSIKDVKNNVRARTTGALPAHARVGNVLTASANGALPAQDGVTLAAGEDLLVMSEAASHLEHGIYRVLDAGAAGRPWVLVRRNDADASDKMTSGLIVPVSEGTAHSDKAFVLTTNDPIVLNTTALAFADIATATITAHEAAADPHTGYQKESEKDQAGGYVGRTANNAVNLPVIAAPGAPVAGEMWMDNAGGAPRAVTSTGQTRVLENTSSKDAASGYMGLHSSGGLTRLPLQVATRTFGATGSPYTSASPTVSECDASGGAFSITLPAANAFSASASPVFIFRKADASANAITIQRAGADTIAGGTSIALNSQHEVLILVSDGVSEWIVIEQGIASANAALAVPQLAADPASPLTGEMWVKTGILYYRGASATQQLERQSQRDIASGYQALASTQGLTRAILNGTSRTGAATLTSTSPTGNKCDASGGAFALTLPAANAIGSGGYLVFVIMKTDSSANAVTITRAGSDTINGATTLALTKQYQAVILVTDDVSLWMVAALVSPPTLTMGDADPGANVTVTAGGLEGRDVFGNVNVTPATATNQRISFQVETGVGTGVYTSVTQAGVDASATNPAALHKLPFSFFCPTGRQYKYVVDVGTPTLDKWSYKEK